MPNNGAETTPGRNNRTARLLTVARLYLNSPPEAPMNCGQMNPDLNDYHSDRMEFSSTFCILDITDWWHQEEERHSQYADLFNVTRDIFSIIPQYVEVGGSISLGQDGIGCRQSKTIDETLREKDVVWQFAQANNKSLADTDPELDNAVVGNSSYHYRATHLSWYVTGLGISRLCITPLTRFKNLCLTIRHHNSDRQSRSNPHLISFLLLSFVS